MWSQLFYWGPRLPESAFRKRQIMFWYINNTSAGLHESAISLLNLSLFIAYPVLVSRVVFFPQLILLFPSSTCLSPLRCRAASWPKSLSAGTSVCSPWCCAFLAMPLWSLNQLAASHPMILPSLPCVRSLEVGRPNAVRRYKLQKVLENSRDQLSLYNH